MFSTKIFWKTTLSLSRLRAVHPIQRPDPPENSDRIRPDQVTGRRRVGLGFPPQNLRKPDPTDVLRFPSKNFQNPAEVSRIRRYFPESGLKFPDSDLKFPNSGNKLSYFGDLSSRSSDILSKSGEISPDLARSHQIRLDLRRIWRFFS